jgi:hypothetical protein
MIRSKAFVINGNDSYHIIGGEGFKSGTAEDARQTAKVSRQLQSYQPDECCGRHLVKGLLSGQLDAAESWICPACGCNWKPENKGELRHWSPVPLIAVPRV